MTISGGRTKQLDRPIFCCVTGFASDFLSFIDVELIRFFHGALQLLSIHKDRFGHHMTQCYFPLHVLQLTFLENVIKYVGVDLINR